MKWLRKKQVKRKKVQYFFVIFIIETVNCVQ